ncbi:hypothetical protein [Hyalangium sp.]|uniref:hypothetical protein n=1 Tax=Hyalangium sp. TaxID=2028555 RepID=UPI002D52CD99|nr:hypothetical protein [Hyalangium sp.]HYI00600.1 hypothetical protein [Hyalangium sp.]
MHRLRRWAAVAGAVGGLLGLGFACGNADGPPSAREREARSELLRDLIASRERMPDPNELQAQRRDLQAELGQGEELGHGGSGQSRLTASVTGTVEWVGDDELLVRDTGGVERDVRVLDDTRFRRGDREVSRRTVEQGAEVQVSYDVQQGEWVALEVTLLPQRVPPPSTSLERR